MMFAWNDPYQGLRGLGDTPTTYSDLTMSGPTLSGDPLAYDAATSYLLNQAIPSQLPGYVTPTLQIPATSQLTTQLSSLTNQPIFWLGIVGFVLLLTVTKK